MPDFIVSANWGLWLLLPLMIALRIVSWNIKKRQAKQIERNARDLADLRSQLGLSAFEDKFAPLM
jgi:type II secretory pathway component PulL